MTTTTRTVYMVQYFDGDNFYDSAQIETANIEAACTFAIEWAKDRNAGHNDLRIIERTITETVVIRVGDEAMECAGCGVQLNRDGSVDALDDDPGSAKHFYGCPVASGESQRPQAACDVCGSTGDHEPWCGSAPEPL